jgi:hypothetical protein
MSAKIMITLTRNQAITLINLVSTETRRMRSRVPLENRTPLFQERLDGLDQVFTMLNRAARLR